MDSIIHSASLQSYSLRFLCNPGIHNTTYKHRIGSKLNEGDNFHVEAELLGTGSHSEFPSQKPSLGKGI